MMTNEEFLASMDENLELPSGTLKGPERLEDLEMWDSVSMMSYIALADTHGVTIAPRQIVGCRTIDDLAKLAGAI
jgi:hypothetical protein